MNHNLTSGAQDNFARLSTLPLHQQALVATTMMERMLPNFLLFSEVANFGDGKVLRDALNVIWEKQQVKNAKINIDKQLEKLEPNIPECENFDMFGVYPALDTVMALHSLLQAMAGDEQGFLDVCKLSYSSVVKVVELELDQIDLTAKQLQEHPLMQYEGDFLAELIQDTEALQSIDKAVIVDYKQRALSDGISNIALEVA